MAARNASKKAPHLGRQGGDITDRASARPVAAGLGAAAGDVAAHPPQAGPQPKGLQRLRETYPPIAAAFGAHLLDINEVVGPGTIDGVHFDPDSLQPVATALAERIRGVFGDPAK